MVRLALPLTLSVLLAASLACAVQVPPSLIATVCPPLTQPADTQQPAPTSPTNPPATTVPAALATSSGPATAAPSPLPTLSGEMKLAVPAESQTGKTFRLTGRGMPKLRPPSEHGDFYAHLVVKVPTELTDHERQLFAELAALRGRPAAS